MFDDFDADIQSDEIIPDEYEYDDFDDEFAFESAGMGTDEDYWFFSLTLDEV